MASIECKQTKRIRVTIIDRQYSDADQRLMSLCMQLQLSQSSQLEVGRKAGQQTHGPVHQVWLPVLMQHHMQTTTRRGEEQIQSCCQFSAVRHDT